MARKKPGVAPWPGGWPPAAVGAFPGRHALIRQVIHLLGEFIKT